MVKNKNLTKLISIYSSFKSVGGAQSLCFSLHEGLSKQLNFREYKISSFDSYNELHNTYKRKINNDEYFKLNLKNIVKELNNAIVISHHRKITTFIIAISKVLKIKMNLVHIAHNEFNSLKLVTLFPKNVIAVSNGVAYNHMNYFKLKNRVEVIYNGIKPPYNQISYIPQFSHHNIKILYPGRVNNIKQQVKIVQNLKSKIPKNIKIIFAGSGNELTKLREEAKGHEEFEVLGHITNMDKIYKEVDFVMLFSKKEGLPLSLIEACSYGLPIVCNDVGGNCEILRNGFNGFLVNSIHEILNVFNIISRMPEKEYYRLSKNSMKQFKTKFSYTNMVNRYNNYIYENFLK